MLSVIMINVTYKPFVLSDVMLRVVRLNVVMLSVVRLNVFMLSVVAPLKVQKSVKNIFGLKLKMFF